MGDGRTSTQLASYERYLAVPSSRRWSSGAGQERPPTRSTAPATFSPSRGVDCVLSASGTHVKISRRHGPPQGDVGQAAPRPDRRDRDDWSLLFRLPLRYTWLAYGRATSLVSESGRGRSVAQYRTRVRNLARPPRHGRFSAAEFDERYRRNFLARIVPLGHVRACVGRPERHLWLWMVGSTSGGGFTAPVAESALSGCSKISVSESFISSFSAGTWQLTSAQQHPRVLRGRGSC